MSKMSTYCVAEMSSEVYLPAANQLAKSCNTTLNPKRWTQKCAMDVGARGSKLKVHCHDEII